MAKLKRYITEQEDRLLSTLRAISKGDITSVAVDTAVSAVKAERPLDTALYSLDDGQNVENFMLENFGMSAELFNVNDNDNDEPSQMVLIDFN